MFTKNSISFLFLMGLILIGFVGIRSAAADELGAREQEAIRAAVEHAAASVVQVQTVGGMEKVGELLASSGPTSGVVVDAEGWIISSAFNFVTQPASIIVTLADGSKHSARIVARDNARMLVLLKIDSPLPLPVLSPLPRSEMRVGQWAIAIGKSYDHVEANVSVGILSALDRIWGRAIQTDAKVSPVNYGGALVDIHGQLMGILVPLSNQGSNEIAGSELYDSGIGFAIPIVDVVDQLDRLKAGENLDPGLMGITLKAPTLYDQPAIIGTCPVTTPAAKAGLRVGDEVVSVDGTAVRHQADMRNLLGQHYAGDVVDIVARRDGQELTARVTLVSQIEPYEQPYLGILAAPQGEAAVVIRHVFAASPAAEAGLEPGDLLLSLDGEALPTVAAWRESLMVAQPGQSVTIGWQRGEKQQSSSITLERLDDYKIPDDLADRSAEGTEAGTLTNIQLPGEPMRCRVLIPEGESTGPLGLIVWLPADPHPSDERLRQAWDELAGRHRFMVMVPQPRNADRWEPAELLTVRQLMDEAVRLYNVDRGRLAVVGVQAGGAVAHRLAAANRDLVRGVCVADAPIPPRTPIRGNDPVERISFLVFTDPAAENAASVAADLEALRQLRVPVVSREEPLQATQLSPRARDVVARWCDSLDRL